MTVESATLAIFLPLVGAAAVPIAALRSRRARDASALLFAALAAAFSTLTLFTLGPEPVRAATWIPWLGIGFDLRLDALGGSVASIAGILGLLVVVYSRGYMREAETAGYSLSRYYALVLLFIGAMIGLALVETLLAFYIFWEVVGLCSFALISFYHRDPKARRAGLKAFAVTRVGDIGLLVAVVAAWSGAGVVTFAGLDGLPAGLAPLVGLGVLLAAIGKSAQFPLQVWLPDAMEAPTTVSALIHAATMVNAGVYLLARTYSTFAPLGWWPSALLWIGSVTALLAAIAALGESDLKRVIAYSTISQIGFLVAAVGAGALVAATFHLLSHAIFKALLFLAAGAVIQAIGSRDLFAMGRLRREMPFAHAAFLAGTLALVGIPFLNGFWSKELLLAAVATSGALVPTLLLLATTALTAAYAWRAYSLIFLAERHGARTGRDAPASMSAVLAVLVGGTATSWLLIGPLSSALAATMAHATVMTIGFAEAWAEVSALPWVLLPVALVGLSAYLVHHRARFDRAPDETSILRRLLRSGFLLDAAYSRMALAVAAISRRLRWTQTGDLNVNVAAVLAALVVLLLVLIAGVR